MPLPKTGLLAQVSAAHLVSHLHIMALPALLPVLPGAWGLSFVELGLALSVFNVVSALVQAPLGFAVDRFGARRLLMAGLLLGSAAFGSLAFSGHYAWLLTAMALAGIANGVYHPADYAMLSAGIDSARMGKAFSVHTFAGFVGGAIAPALLMGIASTLGVRWAFAATGLAGLLAWVFLFAGEKPALAARPASKPKTAAGGGAGVRILTPAILTLTLLYVLLSLSTNSIGSFSVSALVGGYGVNLTWANAAVTAFLFASAFGVLAGGALADRTRRHGLVAAVAFAGAAVLAALAAWGRLPDLALVLCLGATGFLTGVITPSRDMLVRAAAPPGAEGRAFGIVSTGFNIGGAVGPMLFGWLLDRGHFSGVFWAAVVFMALTVMLTLLQEHRAARAPRPLSRPAAG
ncbi:Sugar phosphate permease [Variovorax sp. PDC80]|uniref:MFS transporter n=1 Tax=Variovorax sp. PDC80 TaxID=1882827 RepID=UPI0008EFDEC8|nr:MFS transporter [Variovorax sp. PDC80]SFO95624.1 Sugar phosphate permease [Variovorax sp. PDC80]